MKRIDSSKTLFSADQVRRLNHDIPQRPEMWLLFTYVHASSWRFWKLHDRQFTSFNDAMEYFDRLSKCHIVGHIIHVPAGGQEDRS